MVAGSHAGARLAGCYFFTFIGGRFGLSLGGKTGATGIEFRPGFGSGWLDLFAAANRFCFRSDLCGANALRTFCS